MMDNTPAKKCRKSQKNRHIRPPFSPFYLRKCLINSGRYILSQGTEENSNAICSLGQSKNVVTYIFTESDFIHFLYYWCCPLASGIIIASNSCSFTDLPNATLL